MSLEIFDRAANQTTCDIVRTSGQTLVGVGVASMALGGPIFVPLAVGALALLASNAGCGPTEVDGMDYSDRQGCQYTKDGGTPWRYSPKGGNGNAGFDTRDVKYTQIVDIQKRDSGLGEEFMEVLLFAETTTGDVIENIGGWQLVYKEDKFGMMPDPGNDCTLPPDAPMPPPPNAFNPRPYVDQETGCEMNVQLLSFFSQAPGLAAEPVYLITGAIPDPKSDGGRIVGGCNFEPTVYYGDVHGPGGGGGGGGYQFPYVPGDNEDGTPKWLDTLLSGLAGAGAALATDAILDAIQDAATQPYPEDLYRLASVCEVAENGDPIDQAVEVQIPALKGTDAVIARIDALIPLLQGQKDFKQPICEKEKPELEGDWRTISFRSTQTSPYGKSCLRKRFRYRSTSGIGLGEIVDYWRDFSFRSGPVVVCHSGSSWGTPQVWAATADEGKRVIRHAAGEAGIDPDQVGRWTISSSNSARYGVPATMKVDTTGGYYWITSRDGSNNRPVVATSPHP